MGRTKQGGSILGYVIVGGVLVLLLLAGAYALRNYWSSKPAEVAQTPASQPKLQPNENKNGSSSDQSNKQSSPAPATPVAPAPSSGIPSSQGATQLPQTGPVDTVLSASTLAVIVMTLGVYLQSRRRDASL